MNAALELVRAGPAPGALGEGVERCVVVSGSDLLLHPLEPSVSEACRVGVDARKLVVVGEDDRWISSDLARATADAIPGSDFSLLPGIGHYPMEEMDDFPGFVAGWFSARGLDR